MTKLLKDIGSESKHFWGFAGINVMYFSMWCIIAWYLTLWMEEVAHIDSVYAGIIFSTMAAASLVFQPFFGIISDKLVFKKNLILTISVFGIFIGPYFQWIFLELLQINTLFVVIISGIYLGFILHGGSAVVEQYVQRAALANGFEYGHARMGGSVAGSLYAVLGFQNTYLLMGGIVFIITIITMICLKSDRKPSVQ